ncbi:hypothetical protein Mapa_009034 [Marchantia paleacea]|nr:hypothetical protein Mapa_009034 [Marchantia paleacea]
MNKIIDKMNTSAVAPAQTQGAKNLQPRVLPTTSAQLSPTLEEHPREQLHPVPPVTAPPREAFERHLTQPVKCLPLHDGSCENLDH